MQLTPHEQERLLIHLAADVAERRRARGLRLNHPEAVALITSHILEGARDGRTVADLPNYSALRRSAPAFGHPGRSAPPLVSSGASGPRR